MGRKLKCHQKKKKKNSKKGEGAKKDQKDTDDVAIPTKMASGPDIPETELKDTDLDNRNLGSEEIATGSHIESGLLQDVSYDENIQQVESCASGYSEDDLNQACGGNSNSASNDTSDEEESQIKEIGDSLKRKALTKCRLKLVECMEPVGILDIFKEEALFHRMTTIKVRDIEEIQSTSDKNRAIVGAIETRPSKYIFFKTALIQTGQVQLKEALEREELSEHMHLLKGRQKCVCEDAGSCPVLQDLVCPKNIEHHLPISGNKGKQQFEEVNKLVDVFEENSTGKHVTQNIKSCHVQIGNRNLIMDTSSQRSYTDKVIDSKENEECEAGSNSIGVSKEGDTGTHNIHSRHVQTGSRNVTTDKRHKCSYADKVKDNHQSEWPSLEAARGIKKTGTATEAIQNVYHLPSSTGINISHTTIHTRNAQIGDNNVLMDSTTYSEQGARKEVQRDAYRQYEREDARSMSYAHVTTSPTTTEDAKNVNYNYNINISPDLPKQPTSDLRKQRQISRFLQKTGDFENGHYILVVGSVKPVKNLSVLGLVPWTAVLDYDTESRFSGLLSYIENTIERNRSPHINTWQDKCNFTDQTTCWVFMRGSTDRPDSVLETGFKDWKTKVDKNLKAITGQLETFKQGYSEYTVVVVWHGDKEICRHLKYTLLKLEERLNPAIVLVNDGYDLSSLPCSDYFNDLEFVEIGVQDICLAIQSHFKQNDDDVIVSFRLPTSDKTNEPRIAENEAQALKEELEVLYLDNKTGISYEVQQLEEEEENFFRGGTLPWAWWYHVGAGEADAERDSKDQLVNFIKSKHIDQCKTGVVTLYHAPGSGGTTLAQRVLWDLHKEIPCVQVQHRSDPSTTGVAEKIQFLSDKTHLPILLLMDGEEEQKVVHIKRMLKCCLIILHVKRHHVKPSLGYHDFWLDPFVSKAESKSIGKKFIDQCSRLKKSQKQKAAVYELIEDINREPVHKRSIIEFGLAVHSYEYKGIYSYVKGFLRLEQNADRNLFAWQKALVMLSLAYYYGQTAVPCQLLSLMIKPKEPKKVLVFEDFPSEMKELIVRDPHEKRTNVVRLSHYFVAKEILDQVLPWHQGIVDMLKRQISPSISRKAKQGLEPFVIEFIETAGNVNKHNASDSILKVLIRTIISRDNTAVGEDEIPATRAKKSALSALIDDVSTDAPFTERFNIFEKLTESFPREPEFYAHFGRLTTICRPEEETKAEQCFKKALDICEEETQDLEDEEIPQAMRLTLMHVYHMYGNMFSRRVSKYTGRTMSDRPMVDTNKSDVKDVSLKLFDNTLRACKYFNMCREVIPPGYEQSAGIFGEINVRLMFCDFINRYRYMGKSKNIHSLYGADATEIGEFVGQSFIKLDELFIDCFSSIDPKTMNSGVWGLQRWYVSLFNSDIPGHVLHRENEGVDKSRRTIVSLKMKYSSPKTLGVLDLVTSKTDILQIVEEYEKIFAEVDQTWHRISKRDLDIDYREWMLAIRHSQFPKHYTVEHVLTRVQKWHDTIKTQHSLFYLFILKTLLGFGNNAYDGNTELLIQAQSDKTDLVNFTKFMIKPKYPREWLGPSGMEIRRITPGKRFFGKNIEGRDNTNNVSMADLKLEVMKGTICPPNDKPAVGYISLDLGPSNRIPVNIFYVPARSSLKGEMHKGARVEFVIGFTMSNGYEAFDVQAIGRAICSTCTRINEFSSSDSIVTCTGCFEPITISELVGDSPREVLTKYK